MRWIMILLFAAMMIGPAFAQDAPEATPAPPPEVQLKPFELEYNQNFGDAKQAAGEAKQGISDTILALEAALTIARKAKAAADVVPGKLDAVNASVEELIEAARACQAWAKKNYAELLALYEGAKTRIGILEARIAELEAQTQTDTAELKALRQQVAELTAERVKLRAAIKAMIDTGNAALN